jgi:hypothetical protein
MKNPPTEAGATHIWSATELSATGCQAGKGDDEVYVNVHNWVSVK